MSSLLNQFLDKKTPLITFFCQNLTPTGFYLTIYLSHQVLSMYQMVRTECSSVPNFHSFPFILR
uniref:Uncharacterized protein n=1 Tax=Arundo donax TaxID=35708 RepID=A0A0A9DFE7_ARUDO